MKIIVSYQSDWSTNGTHYTQNIVIPESLKNALENKLLEVKENKNHELLENPFDVTYVYTDLAEATTSKMFLNITSTKIIIHVLESLNIDVTRVQTDRNTSIQFI